MSVRIQKTLSFAVVHFSVAFLVVYAITGSMWVASAMAILEPLLNTVAFFFHDKAWARITCSHGLQTSLGKTLTFGAVHMTVAFALSWVLTGDVAMAGLVALLEPAINTVAFFIHELCWVRRNRREALALS